MNHTKKKFIATFLVPNPMHPTVRFMGFEKTRPVRDAAEAETLALVNGEELLCVKKA